LVGREGSVILQLDACMQMSEGGEISIVFGYPSAVKPSSKFDCIMCLCGMVSVKFWSHEIRRIIRFFVYYTYL